MAIYQSTLRTKASNYSTVVAKPYTFSESLGTKKTAFLCHSHADQELVKGLVVIFKEAGIDLYIDWNDHTMPDTPNGETARKIQERIKSSEIFLFLATASSKSSRWCPWEIGYADSSNKGVYIIPTSDGYDTYGNEYLQLYPKIDQSTYKQTGKPGYFLFEPGADIGYAISNERLI